MQFEMASPRISLAVADETYRSYIKFIENWRIVVGWSENSETFKRLLQIVETRDLPRIASLMEALTVINTPEEIFQLISSGDFEKLLHLPDAAIDLLEMTKDPHLVFEWVGLAGEQNLGRVVGLDLPSIATPDNFISRKGLVTLIESDLNRDELRWLMQLDTQLRGRLLNRAPSDVQKTVQTLSGDDNVSWLLRFVAEASYRDGNAVLNRVLIEPQMLKKIDPKRLKSVSGNGLLEYLNSLDNTSIADRMIGMLNVEEYGAKSLVAPTLGLTVLFAFLLGRRAAARRGGSRRGDVQTPV